MPTDAAVTAKDTVTHILWLNAGLGCDGDSVALTEITLGAPARASPGAMGVPDYIPPTPAICPRP